MICEHCLHSVPVALVAFMIRWGPGHLQGHAAPLRALQQVRPEGRDTAASEVGGADVDFEPFPAAAPPLSASKVSARSIRRCSVRESSAGPVQ